MTFVIAGREKAARLAAALRPWWPRAVTVDDPVDASLAGWLKPQRYVIGGLSLIAAVFGSLVIWNATTEFERGAIGEGTVQPESYRKVISSRYGASVQEILVRENQHVEAGDTLLVMDPTVGRANTRIFERKHWAEQANMARLNAIRDGESVVRFPQSLLDFAAQDDEIAATVVAARESFAASRETLGKQLDQIRSQQKQVDEALGGQRALRAQLVVQRGLIQKELDGVKGLLEQGLERKPKLYELQRTAASLDGDIGAADANTARLQAQRGEQELHAQSAIAEERDTASKRLNEALSADLEYVDRLKSSRDLLSLTVLRAPQSGTVLGVKATIGGVVRPDEPLIEIVPDDHALMLRVVVPPQDINDVKPDTAARVSIHGGGRGLRGLDARVINVSPDLIPHPRIASGTYIAEVEILPGALSTSARKRLQPGMAASVKLITGHRSVWTYMTEGLLDALSAHQHLMEDNESTVHQAD
jgi:HlyD family type I secretion membrane fusion protein